MTESITKSMKKFFLMMLGRYDPPLSEETQAEMEEVQRRLNAVEVTLEIQRRRRKE